jgi:RNA polymerase sigma-70 factor (ECF subfamily)
MGCTATAVEAVHSLGGNAFDQAVKEMAALGSRHWQSLYRVAYRHLGNAADAEDAVQDALLSAHKHLGQFRGQAQMSTWLTAIVVNSARMQLRKRHSQRCVSLDETPGEQCVYPLAERLADGAPSPEDVCRRSELKERVTRLLAQLSPRLRRTFQMRELDGLTIRETANILGVAEGTVKARAARARKRLQHIVRMTRVERSRKAAKANASPSRSPLGPNQAAGNRYQ